MILTTFKAVLLGNLLSYYVPIKRESLCYILFLLHTLFSFCDAVVAVLMVLSL